MPTQHLLRSTRLFLAGIATALALCGRAWSQVPLEAYDAAIDVDSADGVVPAATLTTPVVLTGAAGSAFDFGGTSGDATFEFILEADPTHNASAFLAVGSNSDSSLRYEAWDNTDELGFTLAHVADYQFTPGVASPKRPTHIAYVWDAVNANMSVYVNGRLAGAVTGVDPGFSMPSGSGWLGANPDGDETLLGTIYRVTVYDSVLDAGTIFRHSEAFGGDVLQALNAYDSAVAEDAGAGLIPTGIQSSTVILPKSGTTPFDFGPTSDDVTIEFILKGTPGLNSGAFLAIGENGASNLRFEQWNQTGQLGFTQNGANDYLFLPGVSSPQQATHVVYAWNATALSMNLYVNGRLAGTSGNVDPAFAMPTGLGSLGANSGGGERMTGTIYRVTVYDSLLTGADVARHAKVFTDVLSPPLITSFTSTAARIHPGESTTLSWTAANAKHISLGDAEELPTASVAVSPEVTTTYILSAQNDVGTVSAQLTVYVDPNLEAYDAAIDAGVAAGLVPTARLTTAVSLRGTGGFAFNFGSVTGDGVVEFIVEGDPFASYNSFLAVGENTGSSLRYEQYEELPEGSPQGSHLGFTKNRVADYLFTPETTSPFWPTHLAYVWDSATLTMTLYVNGTFAGIATGVSAEFSLPTGQGRLGSNEDGGEALTGTIFRVTVYSGLQSEETIKLHGEAFLRAANPALLAYDQAVNTDSDNGEIPAARLLAPISLNGSAAVPFNFGTASGDGTIEFILQGNPDANGSSFLAVGTNSVSSLRYEVWDNTGELGFTQGGVADYQFSPGVPSPAKSTHVAYVLNPSNGTMSLFLNGVLAGVTSDVDPGFELPAGLAWLGGSGPGGDEAMVGTIHRVTVYDGILPLEVIRSHAEAFTDAGKGPRLSVGVVNNRTVVGLRNAIPGKHYRIEYRISMLSGELWHLLQDIPSITGTTGEAIDTAPLSVEKQRYYRAVELQ